MSLPPESRGDLELRLEPSLLARLEAAAQRLGISVEDLILAAAADRAEEILGDTRVDDATLAALADQTEAAPEPTPRLDELAQRPRRLQDRP